MHCFCFIKKNFVKKKKILLGPTSGDAHIVLHGNNFGLDCKVIFDGIAVEKVNQSHTHVAFQLPPGVG